MHEPYRVSSGTDEAAEVWPRWPALSGLRIAVRYAVSRSGARIAWWWLRIIVAYLMMPLSLMLHGLRRLGGADPDRKDAASVAAAAWDLDGSIQPLPVVGGSLAAMGWLFLVISALVEISR